MPNVAKAIREGFGNDAKITLFLTPCQFGSGNEKHVAQGYSELDAVFAPAETLRSLSQSMQVEGSGLIVGLGCDLIYLSLMKRKTGYPVVVYSESPELRFPKSYTVLYKQQIGDLMQDSIVRLLQSGVSESPAEAPMIFNAGSRPAQFAQLVPYWVETISKLRSVIPDIPAAISISPFINFESYPEIQQLIHNQSIPIVREHYLSTLKSARLLVTIPGTNTAEAMYLGVPMVMVLPTYFSHVFQFPGLLGLLGEIPLLGRAIKYLIVAAMLPFKERFTFSLPNLLLKQKIVPELTGKISTDYLAAYLAETWNNPLFFDQQIQAFKAQCPTQLIASKMVNRFREILGLSESEIQR